MILLVNREALQLNGRLVTNSQTMPLVNPLSYNKPYLINISTVIIKWASYKQLVCPLMVNYVILHTVDSIIICFKGYFPHFSWCFSWSSSHFHSHKGTDFLVVGSITV